MVQDYKNSKGFNFWPLALAASGTRPEARVQHSMPLHPGKGLRAGERGLAASWGGSMQPGLNSSKENEC